MNVAEATALLTPVERALYITDTHFSYNPPPARTTTPFWEVGFHKLDALIDELKPKVILHGGDVTHPQNRAGRPAPGLLTVLALRSYIESRGVPWVIVPGNHDVAYGRTDPAQKNLSPLSLLEGPLVHVVWEPHCYGLGGGAFLIPYMGEGVIPPAHGEAGLVVSHADYAVGTFMFQTLPVASLAQSYPNAGLVLLGHVHKRFGTGQPRPNGREQVVLNPGPFIRRTVTELQDQPTYTWAVWIEEEGVFGDPTGQERHTLGVGDIHPQAVERQSLVDLSEVVQTPTLTTGVVDQTTVEDALRQYVAHMGLEVEETTMAKAVALFVESETTQEVTK